MEVRIRINKSYLELAVGDITDLEVDAIVNAACWSRIRRRRRR